MLLRIVFTLIALITPTFAAIDVHEFEDPVDERRFRNLIEELRCPKCQNQNIADSNAPLSADLRQRVYDMVQDGRSNEEIVSYLVARYGDFITYRPPLKPATWALWFGPFVIIGMVALGLAIWVRRRRHQIRPALNEQDRERLRALLADSGEEHK